jgi:DNA-binding NtrC family response regulator
MRATVAAALRASGFIVIEAARAGEACVFVESGGLVDLVFSDVEMPGQGDGLELAHSLEAVYPALPVILTSGTSCPGNVAGNEHCQRPFISKPYKINRAIAMIVDILGP